MLTEWVRLLLATVLRTGCGVVELLPGVCLPFLAVGSVPVLTGGAIKAEGPSLRGERLGTALGLTFFPPGAFMSSRVDCLRGEGTGEGERLYELFVGEGIPMPALIGEWGEDMTLGILAGGG